MHGVQQPHFGLSTDYSECFALLWGIIFFIFSEFCRCECFWFFPQLHQEASKPPLFVQLIVIALALCHCVHAKTPSVWSVEALSQVHNQYADLVHAQYNWWCSGGISQYQSDMTLTCAAYPIHLGRGNECLGMMCGRSQNTKKAEKTGPWRKKLLPAAFANSRTLNPT